MLMMWFPSTQNAPGLCSGERLICFSSAQNVLPQRTAYDIQLQRQRGRVLNLQLLQVDEG